MRMAKPQSRTRVDEVEEQIYRISTPVTKLPGGFGFDQYLIEGDKPLLFHTGAAEAVPRRTRRVGQALAIERLRYIAFSHF
jgi:flavorubredoxin